MSETVARRIHEGVGVISLDRPDRHNALDDATVAALAEAIDWAVGSAEVRSVVLRGEGPSFCSGRDTSQLGRRSNEDSHFSYLGRSQEHRRRQLACPKPIVAAVRGACLGLGFETALACDMRIAEPGARFSLPEVRFGLVPDTGGTTMLTALIGPAKTKRMIMTGDRVDAATALEWGIVDEIVPPDELDTHAFALAHRIAAGPPLAVGLAKQLVDGAWAGAIQRGLEHERLAQATLFSSDDYQEARSARMEGRDPGFTGR